jgi:hypothetical protein
LRFLFISPSPPGEELWKGYVSTLDPLYLSLVLTCKHEEEADGKVTESGAYLVRKNKLMGASIFFTFDDRPTGRQGARSNFEPQHRQVSTHHHYPISPDLNVLLPLVE